MGEAGRPKRVHCVKCDRHVSECGKLSKRGRCDECGIETAEAQQRQMNAKAGVFYRDWQRRMARSIGAVLPEDVSHDKR